MHRIPAVNAGKRDVGFEAAQASALWPSDGPRFPAESGKPERPFCWGFFGWRLDQDEGQSVGRPSNLVRL